MSRAHLRLALRLQRQSATHASMTNSRQATHRQATSCRTKHRASERALSRLRSIVVALVQIFIEGVDRLRCRLSLAALTNEVKQFARGIAQPCRDGVIASARRSRQLSRREGGIFLMQRRQLAAKIVNDRGEQRGLLALGRLDQRGSVTGWIAGCSLGPTAIG